MAVKKLTDILKNYFETNGIIIYSPCESIGSHYIYFSIYDKESYNTFIEKFKSNTHTICNRVFSFGTIDSTKCYGRFEQIK